MLGSKPKQGEVGGERLGDREVCVVSHGVVLKRRLMEWRLRMREEPDSAAENLQRGVSSSKSWLSKSHQAGLSLP